MVKVKVKATFNDIDLALVVRAQTLKLVSCALDAHLHVNQHTSWDQDIEDKEYKKE